MKDLITTIGSIIILMMFLLQFAANQTTYTRIMGAEHEIKEFRLLSQETGSINNEDINSLKNKDGRAYFREVWIRRGDTWDVFGVEEPPECYWAYTTERLEKEALKIYERHYGNIQQAIIEIERDRKQAKVGKYLDFARQINNHQNVMQLWGK